MIADPSLTGGPPCRQCGYPMEVGHLVLASGELSAHLDWHDPDPARPGRPGPAVESLPWGPYPGFRQLLGFRCPECKDLELSYGRPSNEDGEFHDGRAAGGSPPAPPLP